MRFNKLLLGAALLVPMMMTSCDNRTKISGLTIDAYENLYAYTDNNGGLGNVVNISTSSPDIEFVDDFKSEYIVFDNKSLLDGKEYTVTRTSSKNIKLSFSGSCSNSNLPNENTLTFSIKKDAFKTDKVVVIEDAKGSMILKRDFATWHGQSQGKTYLDFTYNLKTSSYVSTGITIKNGTNGTENITTFEHSEGLGNSATVNILSTDGGSFTVTLDGLTEHTSSLDNQFIYIHSGAVQGQLLDCFESMKSDYGFYIPIEIEDDGSGNYLYGVKGYSNTYLTKID